MEWIPSMKSPLSVVVAVLSAVELSMYLGDSVAVIVSVPSRPGDVDLELELLAVRPEETSSTITQGSGRQGVVAGVHTNLAVSIFQGEPVLVVVDVVSSTVLSPLVLHNYLYNI